MDQNYSVKSQMSVKSSVNSRFLGLSGTQWVEIFSKEIFISILMPLPFHKIFTKHSYGCSIYEKQRKILSKRNCLKIRLLLQKLFHSETFTILNPSSASKGTIIVLPHRTLLKHSTEKLFSNRNCLIFLILFAKLCIWMQR